MRPLKVLGFSLLLFFLFVQSNERVFARRPHYGLLTPGYGIITKDDLAYDEDFRTIGPYNPNDPIGSLRWQCFPKKEIDAHFDSWKGPDGMGHGIKSIQCVRLKSMCATKENYTLMSIDAGTKLSSAKSLFKNGTESPPINQSFASMGMEETMNRMKKEIGISYGLGRSSKRKSGAIPILLEGATLQDALVVSVQTAVIGLTLELRAVSVII